MADRHPDIGASKVEVTTHEPEMTPERVNRDTTRQRAEQALDGLRTIKNTTGSLTAAQLSNAVRLLATVCLHLARLQLGRHEDTE